MDFLFGWFGLSLVVGLYATTKGRSALGFTLLSIFISPLFGFIFALIIPPAVDDTLLQKDFRSVDRIIELGKMLEKGLITHEEFTILKGKIQ